MLEPLFKGLRLTGSPAAARMSTAVSRSSRTRGPLGPGRGGGGLFDGQVDAVIVINTDDLDFDFLPLREVVFHIIDIRIGDLGDVNQTGPAAGQRYERPKFCDACHLSIYNRTYTKLHTAPMILLEFSPGSLSFSPADGPYLPVCGGL